MVWTRARYAAKPELVSQIASEAVAKIPKMLPPTPEVLASNESLDRNMAASMHMLDEARAQLTAPIADFLPAELTPSEIADKKAAERWANESLHADHTANCMIAENQKLFNDVMGLIGEVEKAPGEVAIAILPPTPTLEELNVDLHTEESFAESEVFVKGATGGEKKPNVPVRKWHRLVGVEMKIAW